MKAISVIQPWGVAILRAGKNVENRDWRMPRGMVGQRIAIHASKRWDRFEVASGLSMINRIRPPGLGELYGEFGPLTAGELHRQCGYILGTVLVLGECDEEGNFDPASSTDPRLVDAHRSPWLVGTYGHVYADPIWFEQPIGPVRGMLGYWTVPDDVAGLVQAAEAGARLGDKIDRMALAILSGEVEP